MKNTKALLVILSVLFSVKSYGQGIPMGSLPMLYNGGFAGSDERARLNGGVSVTAYSPRYTSAYAFSSQARRYDYNIGYFGSYDQFFKKIGTGIGLTFRHDNGQYTTDDAEYTRTRNYLLLSISPKLSFNGKYTLAPFIDVAYLQSEGNAQNLYPLMPMGESVNIRTGLLFNSKKFYAGLTYYIMNDDNRTQFYPYYFSAEYGRGLIFQTGYTFQRKPESKFSFTPQMAVLYFNEGFALDINLMFRYKKLLWSINNNGLGLGFQHKNLRVMLSQSKIFGFPRWSGTLSVRYTLK